MHNTRTGNVDALQADGWKNLGAKLRASSDYSSITLTFEKLKFLVGNNKPNQIQIASGLKAAPTSDASSNFIPPGESREYLQVNLDLVWYKAPDGDTNFEWSGNPEY